MADIETSARPDFDREPRFVARRDAALILGLQFLLLAFRLGQIPLLGPDEPRYARVAIEMSRAGELVTPTLGGEPWLEKPPLYYWLAGIAYRGLGENEAAARLPAVFAGLLMTGFTGLVAARLFGGGCGRLAMLILATSPLAIRLRPGGHHGHPGRRLHHRGERPAHPVRPWHLRAPRRARRLGAHGTRGPGQGTHRSSHSVRRRRRRRPGHSPFRTGAAGVAPRRLGLLLAIAGPWFVAIYLDQGFHFIEVFLLNHNLERFTTTIHNHPGPVYYYLPVLLLGVFPWSGLIPLAAAEMANVERRARIAVLAWMLVPLVLFSAAGSKLPGYILPCLPPLAIALALSARGLRSWGRRGLVRAAGLIGLAASAVLVAFTLRAIRDGEVWGRSALPPALWALAATFVASRAFEKARSESLRILSIGAAGFLLILTLVAPPVLEAMESGRRLFLPAQGREVLVAGAWRTAWMAGYFYNNGRVKDAGSVSSALESMRKEPRLILFGPSEWRQVRSMAGVDVLQLAEGPRGTVLARVSTRSGTVSFSPVFVRP